MGNKEWLCSVGRKQIVEMVMARITPLKRQYLPANDEFMFELTTEEYNSLRMN